MASPEEILKSHGIALTGGIGTGKSTVARLLANLGYDVIDADQLARAVTQKGAPAHAEIAAAFGAEMLAPDGSLDRKRLGQKVFGDPGALKRLEAITHPRIRAALAEELAARGLSRMPRRFFYEAALIFENSLEGQFREVWVTTCPESVQIRRVMQRDGLPEERVRQILASQMPMAEKLARAQRVVETDRPLEALEKELKVAVET